MFKKLIDKIKLEYCHYMWLRDPEEDENDEIQFIWGIKSYDDLSGSECNLHTMNDIDIIYYKEEGKYGIGGIETIYMFKLEDGDKVYIKRLFDRLTEWMIENDYDISRELSLWDVFTTGCNINSKFDTIEELYASFKFLVNGFINTKINKISIDNVKI